MRISRISVSNHQRIADNDIDVREHLVLVGPNAVGKSTLLRLLDFVLCATWSQLGASLDPSQLRDVKKPMVIEVRLENLEPDDIAHFADKVEVGMGDLEGRVWLTVKLSAEVSPTDPDKLDISRSFIKPSVDDSAVTRDDLDQIGWLYLPATRSPDRELGSGRNSAVRQLLRAVSLDSAEQSLIQDALADLSDALAASTALGQLRTDLAVQLTSLFPDSITKNNVTIDLPTSSVDEPLADLDVQIDRGKGKSPLAAQSDGLRSLAVVAVQLLSKSSAKILAIDEPEIHLHPRGQANLANLLAHSPGQRLLATHAPAVLAQFPPQHAVAVVADGARQLPIASFSGDPKRLQHWWIEAALEPLTANRVIFVEGVSDRIIVKAVAELLNKNLDRMGVSVVALNGAGNFTTAIQLFGPNGFDIQIFGLVDENEANIPANALGVSVADLSDMNILTCHSDLEEEYVKTLGTAQTVNLLTGSSLFTEARILASSGASSVNSVTAVELADFVRKHKVEAATAIAEQMSEPDAAAITTVKKLLGRAVTS